MKYKIIMSAFSCLPGRGSEPGVGWNWAIQAAENDEIDVYVLTRTKCREKIEAETKYLKKQNLHFLYVDSSSKLRKKSIYLEYIYWQWKSYLFLKKKIKGINPDLIWLITFGNAFLPIFIHLLKVPFVWGPIGGGEYVARKFVLNMTIKQKILHYLKSILICTAKFNPIVLSPAKHAKKIIVRTRETFSIFPKKYQNKVVQCLETCINSKEVRASANKFNIVLPENKINVCYTGRIISLKNVNMLVNSVIKINREKNICNLYLVGDGEESKKIKELVANSGMQKNIIILGNRSREEALAYVKNSDIFAFPSLKEGGAWSLMEAMALGKACICMDGSGMREIVNNSTAVKVPIISPSKSQKIFEKELDRLIMDKEFRDRLGENAAISIEKNFEWQIIRGFILSICKEIL